MTQKEFEDRTGYKPTGDEFIQINEMYMNTDLDKDVFCKAWVHNRDLLSEIVSKTLAARTQHDRLDKLSDFLIVQAEKWSASDLRDKAIELLGAREYIRRKVTRGCNLWYEDRELINELLKK